MIKDIKQLVYSWLESRDREPKHHPPVALLASLTMGEATMTKPTAPMKTQRKRPARKSVRIWRHGMSQMADRLGVSRTHLWYVVKGIRRSPRIERDKVFQTWRRSL